MPLSCWNSFNENGESEVEKGVGTQGDENALDLDQLQIDFEKASKENVVLRNEIEASRRELYSLRLDLETARKELQDHQSDPVVKRLIETSANDKEILTKALESSIRTQIRIQSELDAAKARLLAVPPPQPIMKAPVEGLVKSSESIVKASDVTTEKVTKVVVEPVTTAEVTKEEEPENKELKISEKKREKLKELLKASETKRERLTTELLVKDFYIKCLEGDVDTLNKVTGPELKTTLTVARKGVSSIERVIADKQNGSASVVSSDDESANNTSPSKAADRSDRATLESEYSMVRGALRNRLVSLSMDKQNASGTSSKAGSRSTSPTPSAESRSTARSVDSDSKRSDSVTRSSTKSLISSKDEEKAAFIKASLARRKSETASSLVTPSSSSPSSPDKTGSASGVDVSADSKKKIIHEPSAEAVAAALAVRAAAKGGKVKDGVQAHKDTKAHFVQCPGCGSAPMEATLYPCEHTVSCAKCVSHIKACPVCKNPIANPPVLKKEMIPTKIAA